MTEDYRIILRTTPKDAPAVWGTATSFEDAKAICEGVQKMCQPIGTILVLQVLDRSEIVYLFHAGSLIRIDPIEFRV